jgi:hypothetical protein
LMLGMNLSNLAFFQRRNFGFNSFMEIGGKVVGATENGLFEMEGVGYPDGDVEAAFELSTTDLGSKRMKRFRRLYLGGVFGGDLVAKVKFDDGEFESYPVEPVRGGLRHEEVRVPVGREQRGYYATVRVENADGVDFGVDTIDAEVVFTEK